MRFDPEKAEAIFGQLGNPRFAGSDGEQQVAEFVAERFAEVGLDVERRDVLGSAFPQWLAPFVGPIGFGILITVAYLLVLTDSVVSWVVSVILAFSSTYWADGLFGNSIRLGGRRPPLRAAPVVIGSMKMVSPAPRRVVFQAIVGGLEVDFSHLLKSWNVRIIRGLTRVVTPLVIASAGWKLCSVLGVRLTSVGVWLDNLIRYVCPGFLAVVWVVISRLILSHYRTTRSSLPERNGLSLLIELARSWPRSGARAIEPVFVVAGGQRLDYAGSREVACWLGSAWGDRPTLLILLIPGGGDTVWLSTNELVSTDTDKLAKEAAQSLWIPAESVSLFNFRSLWAFAIRQPMLALIGSGSRDSFDPRAVQRFAGLATEIALRWAKRPVHSAATSDSVG